MSWTFDLDYSQFLLAGVIWMLGWCMVLLAGFICLPLRAIGVLGLLIILAQNAFGAIGGLLPQSMHPLWELIYPVGAELRLGASGPAVTVLYTIVPWIGVMCAGYAFGSIMVQPDNERRRWCIRIGLAATVLFVLIAGGRGGTQGGSADGPPLWIRFLNQRKYPASPLFLLMTLGPLIALLPFAERARGWFAAGADDVRPRADVLLPAAHSADSRACAHRLAPARRTALRNAMPPRRTYRCRRSNDGRWRCCISVWLVAVAILYPLCRWYAKVKARRPESWLRYV